MFARLDSADHRITRFIANRQRPLLTDIMTGLSSLGSPVNSLVFLTIMFVAERALFHDAVTVLLVSWIIVYSMKHLISRDRPAGSVETGMTSSFPSGHSATAFGQALVIMRYIPDASIFLVVLASLVSFSRLYLQTHYASDIAVGTLIGSLVALLI